MPIYEYSCRSCGKNFEKQLRIAERLNAPNCPACGQNHAMLVMSAPARVGAGTSSSTASDTLCPSTGSPCSCGRAGHHH